MRQKRKRTHLSGKNAVAKVKGKMTETKTIIIKEYVATTGSAKLYGVMK